MWRKKHSQRVLKERGHWGNKVEYVLVAAGNIVGLGNVWRFPYLCYKNGGGAFLVPYLVFIVTCGVPLFLLETTIGQYTQQGAVTCWRKMCPLAQGIGYGGQLIQVYNSMTYIIILSWAVLYLVFSFYSALPWSTCDNYWNTANCVDVTIRNHTNHSKGTASATEFWDIFFTLSRRRVLNISGGIEEIGSIRWELLVCLLAVWVVCYFSLWKGVKSSGKVVYFTATFPYVMLLILLIRGVTLPGARQGVEFYVLPEVSRLKDPHVWMEACSQIFYSYSLGVGTLTVLGSYNTQRNNCYKDSLLLCLLNSCTSVVAGFAVFSVLGFMAHEQGVPISQVAESGPGLAFIAYPQAVAMMPLPQFWAVCFFIMIILLGLDTQFVGIEGVMTSFSDIFPRVMRLAGRREIFLLLFCLTAFFFQLIMITEGGMYIFQIFDYYACSGACILFVCVFESLAVGWIFGAERLCGAIKDMTGERVNPFFKFCWLFLTPFISMGSFIYSLVEYTPLTYNRIYVYPTWVYVMGWVMAFSSILQIPGWALYKLSTASGTLCQRLHRLCWPDPPDRSEIQKRETMLAQTTEEACV
ncbi:sodium- and chloride-dependent GABA transporter 2-like [Syngnathoides biaculeatus]|uniref:sodium- and chloride-dependent GABA transporter 2-like n=1 Tax=Syngnathoides biaculeatus TaxID=300417 RepID=UPI002ADD7089|nr:sodium- and chloride-dependent GABA transporter 2-like [Syngnathoides biaculeatus]